MTRILKQDERYRIEDTNSEKWFRAYKDNEMLGLCMSLDTARQVIYKEILKEKNECEFLLAKDFFIVES